MPRPQLLAGVAKVDITDCAAGKFTFVAGYLFYLPTEAQQKNTGDAPEDCDCLVAPERRKIFDGRTEAVLEKRAK